jgi:hypothetical protein
MQYFENIKNVTIRQDVKFVGAFAIFRKLLLDLTCPYVRLSVRMEQLESHWTDFNKILNTIIFWKNKMKPQDSLNSDKNKGYFTWRLQDVFHHTSLSFFKIEKFFIKKCRENQNTYSLFHDNIFLKSYLLRFYVEIICRVGQTTDDNMVHAHCMLDN